MKQIIIAFKKFTCQQKYAFQLKLTILVNITRTSEAVTLRHVNMQVMSVDPSISNMYMLKYGHGWAGALAALEHCLPWHKDKDPHCEAFECCQGKPIRGSVGLACHDMFHAFFFKET